MPRDEGKDPFDQLERCHRRLEEACDALGPATEMEDRATLEDVAAFLARQIRRHEDDEDESLFPRLARVAELAPTIARLKTEHAHHGELQSRFRQALEASAWPELRKVSDELVRAYREHIAVEESELFPAARAALTEADLGAIRDEMNARRGR
jgi:hemerythrin-like domain-containing protein